MLGIIPAAGVGSRIQPLAFSKELLPVGSRFDGEVERPRAVSEYLIERMAVAGCARICFVISPYKGDILSYYGASAGGAHAFYVVQPHADGLTDAIFRALPFVEEDDEVCIGLPDTVWFPVDGLCRLGDDPLSFLCFPVDKPELFDAVVFDRDGLVEEIQVKEVGARSHYIWGAVKARGWVLAELHQLWLERDRRDPYLGTLVNAWLERGRQARAVCAGESYVDVGTLNGYREAIQLLARQRREEPLHVIQP